MCFFGNTTFEKHPVISKSKANNASSGMTWHRGNRRFSQIINVMGVYDQNKY